MERLRLVPAEPADVDWLTWGATGAWEADTQVTNGNGDALALAESDPVNGFWGFTVAPGAVYLTGRRHDIYRAAVAVLETEQARQKDTFDLSVDGQSFKRSQRITNRDGLIAAYRRKMRPRLATMSRSDAR